MRNCSKPTRPLRRPCHIAFLLLFCAIPLAPGTERLSARALELASLPQADGTFPVEWADELGALGDLVARISPPPAKVDLAVHNISSLSANETAAIDAWLRSTLGTHHFQLVDGEPADERLNVTLSEGIEGYLIVAQLDRGADEQVAIFPVGRPPTPAGRSGGVALADQLLWAQPGNILDFAPPQPGAGEPPLLTVLEVGRIAFYARNQGQWQLNGSVTIPPVRPWLRAPRGYLDLSRGLADGTAMLAGVECLGDFGHPGTIACSSISQEQAPWTSQEAWRSKNLPAAGDAALISLICDGRDVALATGSGDWTQTDVVQGYEIDTLKGQGAVASGSPLELGGPVTALWPMGRGGMARAVVRNLQTGNYEAHLVTATCSQ